MLEAARRGAQDRRKLLEDVAPTHARHPRRARRWYGRTRVRTRWRLVESLRVAAGR
jgi:hypothetical protein